MRTIWTPSQKDAETAINQMSKTSPVLKEPHGGRWYFTWEGELTWTSGIQETFPQHRYSQLPKKRKHN